MEAVTAPPEAPTLDSPELYTNRELSWLQFNERVRELGHRHSRQWEDHVRPALAEHGIRVIDCEACDARELEKIDRQFSEEIFPVLTPLAVGPGRPFPYISNLSLSLAGWLRDPG